MYDAAKTTGDGVVLIEPGYPLCEVSGRDRQNSLKVASNMGIPSVLRAIRSIVFWRED